MRIVVNVDDAGLHPAVNRAAAELAKAGTVSSASVVANGKHVREAASMQGLGLGVHLNILRGRPLGDPDELNTLVDEDGMFLADYPRLFMRYVTGRVDPEQVYKEWCLQVQRLLDLGMKPDHIDSEKHVHAWPTLMDVAGRVARRFGIRHMRKPLECGKLMRLDRGMARVRFLNVCSFFQKQPEDIITPDSLWGISDQGNRLTPQRFAAHVRGYGLNTPDTVVEICCHPGNARPEDGELDSDYGRMRVDSQWKAEYESLSSHEWKDVFAQLGATVVRFGDL